MLDEKGFKLPFKDVELTKVFSRKLITDSTVTNAVGYLIDKGADVNEVALFGNTLLANLCDDNHHKKDMVYVVRFLLEKGADAKTASNFLMGEVAAYLKEEKIYDCLKNNGHFLNCDYIALNQEIEDKILTDDFYASVFAKDPKKQNLPEKEAEIILGVPKLSASGKNCIRFNDEGEIVFSAIGATKSADFYYRGYYVTQKYTTSSGGAQDNQRNDVIDFLTRGSKKHLVMAIVDGEYWDTHRADLVSLFLDNPNVVITSLTEITKEV